LNDQVTEIKIGAVMKFLVLALGLALSSNAISQSPATPVSASQNALVIEVMVPAPIDAVWQAFSTSEGLSTWLTPGAVVDLRAGGEWTAHFPGGSTGGGTIVSFVPRRDIVLSALAPDRFPHVRAERTKVEFHFDPVGGVTRVRLTQTGWKDGEEWDKAYEYLTVGNAQLLAALHHRFVSGPTDWTK
jgi:uncharacterized protein YndB with AHSA1/START domain